MNRSYINIDPAPPLTIGQARSLYEHVDELYPNEIIGNSTIGENYVDARDINNNYVRALDIIYERSILEIQRDPQLNQLLSDEKRHWTLQDRELWEGKVSLIVSREMDQIPGLNEYRTQSVVPGLIRTTHINEIAPDIALDGRVNARMSYEFDCEQQTITEGIVLQKLDDTLLTGDNAGSGYRQRADYMYVVGKALFPNNPPPESERMAHAFIVSSSTHNIIEATKDPSYHRQSDPYEANVKAGYGFENFARTEHYVTSHGAIYASLDAKYAEMESTQRIVQEMGVQGFADRYAQLHGGSPAQQPVHNPIFEPVPEPVPQQSPQYSGIDRFELNGFNEHQVAFFHQTVRQIGVPPGEKIVFQMADRTDLSFADENFIIVQPTDFRNGGLLRQGLPGLIQHIDSFNTRSSELGDIIDLDGIEATGDPDLLGELNLDQLSSDMVQAAPDHHHDVSLKTLGM
ncbi:MAG: hypothetical protein ACLFU1_08300 [Alphaproteobacteria bacterium]